MKKILDSYAGLNAQFSTETHNVGTHVEYDALLLENMKVVAGRDKGKV